MTEDGVQSMDAKRDENDAALAFGHIHIARFDDNGCGWGPPMLH
jgi:hypothetical protein